MCFFDDDGRDDGDDMPDADLRLITYDNGDSNFLPDTVRLQTAAAGPQNTLWETRLGFFDLAL